MTEQGISSQMTMLEEIYYIVSSLEKQYTGTIDQMSRKISSIHSDLNVEYAVTVSSDISEEESPIMNKIQGGLSNLSVQADKLMLISDKINRL